MFEVRLRSGSPSQIPVPGLIAGDIFTSHHDKISIFSFLEKTMVVVSLFVLFSELCSFESMGVLLHFRKQWESS